MKLLRATIRSILQEQTQESSPAMAFLRDLGKQVDTYKIEYGSDHTFSVNHGECIVSLSAEAPDQEDTSYVHLGYLSVTNNEGNLDPAPRVVDVCAKEQREHQRGHCQHHDQVGEFAEIFEMDAVHTKHDEPPQGQQPHLLEQEFGAVAVGFVRERADCAVHCDQRGHGQHQGNAPEHAVAFQPLTDPCDEFVHRLASEGADGIFEGAPTLLVAAKQVEACACRGKQRLVARHAEVVRQGHGFLGRAHIVAAFNQPVGSWNASKATAMGGKLSQHALKNQAYV